MVDLKNCKVLFLGDSITEGYGASNNYGYAYMFRDRTGAYTHIDAIGGTGYALKKIPSVKPRHDIDFFQRLEGLPHEDFDFVVCFGGTNDWGHGDAKIGNIDDTSRYTFYGAANCIYENLKKMYPNSKIVIFTPLHRSDENILEEDGRPRVGKLADYVKAEKEVAKKYGFIIYDLYEEKELDATNPEICKKLFADGLHLNDEGYKLLTDKVINFLSNI